MNIMNTSKNYQRSINIQKHRGFTLLEALLGFLILAIGMLGIASLQAISLKAGKTSVYSSVAMMKADELFESMRANPSSDALTAYVAASAGTGSDNGCTGTTNCTDAQLAQEDVYWWKKNLKAGLPDAVTATVTIVAAVPPSKMATATIEVKWEERDKDSEKASAKTYTTNTTICNENPC